MRIPVVFRWPLTFPFPQAKTAFQPFILFLATAYAAFFSIRCSLSPVSLRVQAVKQKSLLEISDREGLIRGISYLSN